MRTIRLPEPPTPPVGMPEIFERGVYSVVRRAVVIGNGFAGAENQCVGLVRALGLSERQSLYYMILLLVGAWNEKMFSDEELELGNLIEIMK
ncbi:hypothetical protein QJS10_CPA02g01022 [Acorus calamus]|uniref:Uncharacterized protein n=1 Tax=Acorus calamus TaxID=4465 RepID=A0AAV9FCI8_ACOCL|nr:hypothetical protein QJS10_CPA02g01022 [Acorus calamus]